eukprot:jgi/Chlat1/5865/Chrsp4S06381
MASAARDRTAEFMATAERLRKSVAVSAVSSSQPSTSDKDPLLSNGHYHHSPQPSSSSGSQSEFARRASRIGLGIHSTSQKLGKLAKLAKRTSMFDDPAQEIQELTAVIKKDITALNGAIAELQSLRVNAEGTKQSADHSATVVDSLKTRLMGATKDFKDVLSLRSENLKQHQSRRSLFSSTTDDGPPLPGAPPLRAAASTSALPFAPRPAPTSLFGKRQNGPLLPMHSTPGQASSAGLGQQQQQQQQQQMMVPAQDQYLQSRAEALQNVESTIAELSSIFTQLATMVAQQGEVAIRIDENMDETLANVDNAQTHLLKYLSRLSSNRWLIMKVFFVLIMFLVIFVVFVA